MRGQEESGNIFNKVTTVALRDVALLLWKNALPDTDF